MTGVPDAKAARAAALARNKKSSSKKSNFSYIFWVGGSLGSVVLACVMLMISPEKGPFQTPVNDQSLIVHINRNAKTWQAGASSFFEGWTVGDVKLLDGVGVSQGGGGVAPCTVPDVEVPRDFDARQKWEQCFTSPIYNMGNCTASWAVATASALSNRFCIADPETHGELMLSPQQLLSCDASARGCSGGGVDTAWNYIEREGLVSELCFPYQADGTVSCNARCTQETPLKSSGHCSLNSEQLIMREVFQNGPVVALIFLVDDFLVYRGGLYKETPTSKQLTGTDGRRNRVVHAVKIVGWGEGGGHKYWIVENSWGEDWGEHGFARIVRGGDPEARESIMIESYVIAGTPASSKIGDEREEDIDLEDDGPAAAAADTSAQTDDDDE